MAEAQPKDTIDRITFVGIGHMKSQRMLCTWNNANWGPAYGDSRLEVLSRLPLAAGKKQITPGHDWKLNWGNKESSDMVYLRLAYPRGELLFMVIVHNSEEQFEGGDYPDHVAYTFLKELEKRVENELTQHGRIQLPSSQLAKMETDGLSVHLQQLIVELALRFDDPVEYDKLAKVMARTKQIKDVTKQNVNKMLHHTENLHVLDEQAAAMEKEAEDYDDAAEEIKEYFWWKDCRVTLLIAVAVVVILALIALCIYKSCVKGDK